MTRRKPPKPPRVATMPARADTIRDVDGELEKLCRGCDSWLPASTEFFTSHEGRPDSLSYRCKACNADYQAAQHLKRRGPKPTASPPMQLLASVAWLGSVVPGFARSAL